MSGLVSWCSRTNSCLERNACSQRNQPSLRRRSRAHPPLCWAPEHRKRRTRWEGRHETHRALGGIPFRNVGRLPHRRNRSPTEESRTQDGHEAIVGDAGSRRAGEVPGDKYGLARGEPKVLEEESWGGGVSEGFEDFLR